MKTIKEWLEQLPQPTRDLALKYAAENAKLNMLTMTLASAVNNAFIWDYTDEGSTFWQNVWEYCIETEVTRDYLSSRSSR